MNRPAIVLASTGGTITMTPRADGDGVAPTLDASALAASVPGLAAIADVTPVAVACKPSASLTLDDVITVADLARASFAAGADGAVVVQGTDTIEETAFALALLLPSVKPVVVTGAMRAPAMAGADGPANLLSAVIVASSEAARGLGPVVVLNDEIHAAQWVQKGHTGLTSAFMSPGFGRLGVVSEGRARIMLRPASPVPEISAMLGRPAGAIAAVSTALSTPMAPAVALLRIGLGDDGRLLEAAPDLGFSGVVIEGVGAGHVPESMAAIVSRVAGRIPVVLASRVVAGPVLQTTYGYPGSEIDLLGRGAICAGFLSGLKARILLQLLLRAQADAAVIHSAFAGFAATA